MLAAAVKNTKVGLPRQAAYSSIECRAITQAMTNVRNDALRGADQKGDNLHERFCDEYKLLQNPSWPKRSLSSLVEKFGEIRRECLVFAGLLKRKVAAVKQSGETNTVEKHREDCLMSYRTVKGREFAFYECYLIMKDQPCFAIEFGNAYPRSTTTKMKPKSEPDPRLALQNLQRSEQGRTQPDQMLSPINVSNEAGTE